MVEVIVTTPIERPAAEVFDYIVDMENNPTWQKGMQSCVWTSEPPLRVGSTYDQQASFLGKTITSSFEVTELEPGSRIRINTTSGSMPIDVLRSVRAVDANCCEIRAEVRGEPAGMFPFIMKLAAPLMTRMVRTSVQGDYARLKTQLEAQR